MTTQVLVWLTKSGAYVGKFLKTFAVVVVVVGVVIVDAALFLVVVLAGFFFSGIQLLQGVVLLGSYMNCS